MQLLGLVQFGHALYPQNSVSPGASFTETGPWVAAEGSVVSRPGSIECKAAFASGDGVDSLKIGQRVRFERCCTRATVGRTLTYSAYLLCPFGINGVMAIVLESL